MKKLYFVIFLFFFISQSSFAQLSNFTLTVTGTAESCTGNGTLTFNVSNTTPGSTIIYRIYKLPDVVNSIAVLSTNTFGGLTAGTYRVIATQTLDNGSGTQQQDVVILDTRTQLTYEISNTQETCDTGTINVNVLTGNPATYEIISGPVIITPQASNSFPNLYAGTYNIRVIDDCGEGIVQAYTLTFTNPPNLVINDFTNICNLSTCNSMNAINSVQAQSGTIRYPLTVQVTVFPPSGPNVVLNQIITSGGQNNLVISNLIPFYYNQLYTYTIRIVDACGNIYVKENQVNLRMTAFAQERYSNCLNGIRISMCNALPPYSVSFLSAPAGFNPQTFNAVHPGPFMGNIQYNAPNIANLLPVGDYTIQVTDACGHTATTQVELNDHEPGYTIIIPPNVCDDRYLQIPENPAVGPLISSAIFTASTADLGHPIPYDVSGNIVDGVLYMQLPEGTYQVEGMDVCGNPYNYTIIIPPKTLEVRIDVFNANGCSTGLGSVRIDALGGSRITSIVIVQAPTAFTQPLPHTAYSAVLPELGVFTFGINPLPIGNYVVEITDNCNNIIIRNFTIGQNISTGPLGIYERRGCGENYDSVAITSPNGRLVSVVITAAPPSFPHPLPYDVTFNIAPSDGNFYMNSFLEGSYTFFVRDNCSIEFTSTINLIGYHSGGNIEVLDNCGSFGVDMNFSDTTTGGQNTSFWLQKFNPLTNQWIHPMTGVVYPNNSIPTQLNSYPLNNLTANYNIVATGTFRIITTFNYYNNGTTALGLCVETVETFEYTGELRIVNAYAIPCVNGGNQVFIITNGTPPLDYKITTKDGQSFIVNNGNSNSFASLQAGIYNFRVEDACGNIVNRLLDITTLQQPEIASSNLCVGLNGQLSVQPFSFLNYEWWKEGSPGTILSTTNVLTFSPYSNANAGVYHVRIYSTTTNSCVDRVLNYTIAPEALPNAGLDGNRIICNSTGNINLFTVLGAPYDNGGTWQEITSSGMLIGSHWLATGLPLGTYVFRYTVNGFCNSADDATVTLTLNENIDSPVVNVNTSYCPGEDLVFSIQPVVATATYEWTGPNNFSSALTNPTIPDATADNAGVYTIKATLGQCEAETTVTVVNKPKPEYTYDASCDGSVFRIEIIPTQSSFDPNTATYVWTGPNGFAASINPLILTNQPIGDYSVVVTNSEGCFSPQSMTVANTFCDFPNVITPGGDGINDSFDLTGYDVDLFQVFSRWGRLVYEQNNYTNQWYGQNMHGGLLPDSTYYYFLKLRNGEEKHGWVFIGIKGNNR